MFLLIYLKKENSSYLHMLVFMIHIFNSPKPSGILYIYLFIFLFCFKSLNNMELDVGKMTEIPFQILKQLHKFCYYGHFLECLKYSDKVYGKTCMGS